MTTWMMRRKKRMNDPIPYNPYPPGHEPNFPDWYDPQQEDWED